MSSIPQHLSLDINRVKSDLAECKVAFDTLSLGGQYSIGVSSEIFTQQHVYYLQPGTWEMVSNIGTMFDLLVWNTGIRDVIDMKFERVTAMTEECFGFLEASSPLMSPSLINDNPDRVGRICFAPQNMEFYLYVSYASDRTINAFFLTDETFVNCAMELASFP